MTKRYARLCDPVEPIDLYPTEDRVLIEPLQPEETTAGGIVLAGEVAERDERTHGRVVAVGPGRTGDHGKWIDTLLRVGDEVYYEARYALPIERSGRTLYVMREPAVVAVAGRKPEC